ncbi:MAG: STAS domain-containing protein [Lachnospiraceae bacterium]|nr:STAS domain-containing protein [Lachnospiraceae bacterium]
MLKIENIRDNENLTIKLYGKLDITTSSDLEKVVKGDLDDVKYLEFDFSELEYISSSGLRVLLIAIKKMNTQGELIVSNANEVVKEVFKITGFHNLVKMV